MTCAGDLFACVHTRGTSVYRLICRTLVNLVDPFTVMMSLEDGIKSAKFQTIKPFCLLFSVYIVFALIARLEGRVDWSFVLSAAM